MLHPFCGMDAAKGCVETVRPVKAVIGHLQEMGHPKERFRWTYQNGLDEKRRIEEAGTPAIMPLWGPGLHLPGLAVRGAGEICQGCRAGRTAVGSRQNNGYGLYCKL